jgi:hypothetical protein
MIFRRSEVPCQIVSLRSTPPSYGAEGGYGSPRHFAATESGSATAITN